MIPFNAGIATATVVGQSAGTGTGAVGAGGLAGFFAALLAQGQFGAADTTLLDRTAQGVAQQNSKMASDIGISGVQPTKTQDEDIEAIIKALANLSDDDIQQLISLISSTYDVGKGGTGSTETVEGMAADGADANNLFNQQATDALLATSTGEISFAETILEFKKEVVQFIENAVVVPTGMDDNAKALAAAYMDMGMSPEAAVEKAQRTESALNTMRAYLSDFVENADISELPEGLQSLVVSMREITYTQMTSISITQVMSAFESSSALTSVDVATQAIKGAPITAEAIVATDAVEGVEALPKTAGEIVANNAQEAKVADQLEAQELSAERAEMATDAMSVESASDADQISHEGVLAHSRNTLDESAQRTSESAERQTDAPAITRPTTEVRQGLLNETPQGETLFKVTASETGGALDTIETAEGEIIQGTNFDQSVDDAMESLNNRASLDARVEGKQINTVARQSSQQALVAQQAALQMRSLAQQGGGVAKFLLNPPELGQLEVHLEVTSVKAVKATFVVQSQEVAEQLARDLQQLEKSLADSGLELDREGFEFKLSDDQAGADAQKDFAEGEEDEDGSQQAEATNRASGAESSNETAQQQAANWVRPDALLDMNV